MAAKFEIFSLFSADIFIVWANVHGGGVQFPIYTEEEFSDPYPTLTAFLVDTKECSGVKVEKDVCYSLKGLKGSGIRSVSFEDVIIPGENQLSTVGDGFNMLTVSLKDEAKLVSSVQILAGLRKVLNQTFKHATSKRAFGQDLYEFPLGEFCPQEDPCKIPVPK